MLWLLVGRLGGERECTKGSNLGTPGEKTLPLAPLPSRQGFVPSWNPTPGEAVCPDLEMCFRKGKRCCRKVLAGMPWPGLGLSGPQVGLLSELVPVPAGGPGLYSAHSPGSWLWLA